MGSSSGLEQKTREEEARGENHDRADLRGAVLWVTAPKSRGIQFDDVPTLAGPSAATSRTAAAYGLSDRDTINAGAQADLLLATGKPDENILDTRRTESIWKSGKVHNWKIDQTAGR